MIFLLLCIIALAVINLIRTNSIMATQAEEAEILRGIKTRLDEALTELLAKIQELTDAVAAAGATTPEVDSATADVRAIADRLADIVPNPPPPEP